MRIKRGVNAVKKRRKILKLAKGYRGAKSKLYRLLPPRRTARRVPPYICFQPAA